MFISKFKGNIVHNMETAIHNSECKWTIILMKACTVNPEIVTLLNVNDFLWSCVITFFYFNDFYGAKIATVQL